jgi:hypothetical protein
MPTQTFAPHPHAPARAFSRRIFRDEKTDEAFARQGYVILPVFDPAPLQRLAELHESSDPGVAEGFFTSTHCPNTAYRDEGDRAIRETCEAAIMEQVLDYRVLVANFLIKKPGEKSALPLHQDWMMVDETRFSSINVWFPVRPVTPENGPLCVLPGSHRFVPGLRGSLWYPTALNDLREEIGSRFLVPLDVPLGHAVFMDSALVHASPANRSGGQRIAACLNIAPREAELFHYFFDHENDRAEKYVVTPDFFLHATLGKRPEGFPLAETIEHYRAPEFGRRDLYEVLGQPFPESPDRPAEQPVPDAAEKPWWKRWFS